MVTIHDPHDPTRNRNKASGVDLKMSEDLFDEEQTLASQ